MNNPIVYPRPQWYKETGQAFPLSSATPILATEGARAEAAHLQRWLEQDYGLTLNIVPAEQGGAGILVGLLSDEAIRRLLQERGIRVDGREATAEGYLLDIVPDCCLVAGHDAAGVFYGLQRLRQLVQREDTSLCVPAVEMHDWPYKPMRGVHIYMPSRAQIPFCRRFFEFLATLRYNQVFLEVGGGMRYDRHPEINRAWETFVSQAMAYPGGPRGLQSAFPWPKDSTHTELAGGSFLEKDEVRTLLEYARSLHIEVIPEVQSLSHAYYLCCAHPEIAERPEEPFPDTYCPSNPVSYALYFDVLEEVIEVFQPGIVHTGHDEVYTLGLCPRCQGKSGADLLAGDINRIHDFLAGKGIRMALWGDKLMSIIVGGRPYGGRELHARPGGWFSGDQEYVMRETYPAVDLVPKDILMLDWYWVLDPSSQAYFGQQGFEEIFGNFGDNFAPHTFTRWEQRAAAPHVLGAEVSTWCDVSEFALGRNACLFNLMFSAQMLWWRHYSDRERERALQTVATWQPRLRDALGARRSPSLQPGAQLTSLFPACGMGQQPATPALHVGPGQSEAGALTIGVRADSLLFLHHCHCRRLFRPTWDFSNPLQPSPEDIIGWYRVLYADGSETNIEIRYGETIANSNIRYGEDIAAVPYWAEPVWEGRDEEGLPVVLYRYEWLNPDPDKEIQSLSLKLADLQGTIDLYGLTAVQAR